MGDRTDKELIEQCLEGDSSVFEVLVKRYQLQMFRTALGIVGNPDRARDVTQNGFIKAWEKLDSFDPRYPFVGWLYRIIVNESLNAVRDSSKLVSLSRSIADENTPYSQMVKTEEQLKVKKAIQQLKPDYRVVVLLRHFEELSYGEIADVLEIEEKTVKSRLYTARNQLRAFISEQD